jgi:N-methylhydantoinase A
LSSSPRTPARGRSFVAVDTGGTFTDLVAFDPESHAVSFTKALTTPADPAAGIFTCVDKVHLRLAECDLFKHGTTHVINTLLERSGPRIASVATRGFADVLEFGRGNRTEPFNLFYRRDPPLVPRELRFELSERIDGQGKVLTAPQRQEVERLAEEIRRTEVAAVAISFLNAYLNPAHEELVAGWLRDLLPGCYVTSGTELTREWYEFERSSTAAANAYAGPRIGRYVEGLARQLRERKFEGQFLLMGSNGGALSVQHAAAAPILLVESGPVGGCIGADAYAKALGLGKLIAFDMGGTTAKCAIVDDGFEIESIYYVGGYGRGIPIRAPVVDIVEVGAGGGSIAWLDAQTRLHVGPRSAGSTPGPVAYGLGGTQPTVTDANLVLNRLDPASFQGGEMKLDVGAARRAIEQQLCAPLGYPGEGGLLEIARGILSIAEAKMSEAIKRITVQRGQDPRDFTLFAYGGGGPLHAMELARELGIPMVVIPPEAGNFSAIGMLLADIRRDAGRTFLRALNDETVGGTEAEFADMERAMASSLAVDFGDIPVLFERSAEMRYVGQYHTVRLELHGEDAATLRRGFDDLYRARYGHASDRAQVQIVSLHSVARARTSQPDIARLCGELPREAPATARSRPVFFLDHKEAVRAPVYARRNLPRGFSAEVPAVIEEYGSTTLVGPRDRFEIGKFGEIRITVDRRSED